MSYEEQCASSYITSSTQGKAAIIDSIQDADTLNPNSEVDSQS